MRWVLVVTVATACYSPRTEPSCAVHYTVIQPGGSIQTFFGVFAESAGIPGTPAVDVDNVLICVE